MRVVTGDRRGVVKCERQYATVDIAAVALPRPYLFVEEKLLSALAVTAVTKLCQLWKPASARRGIHN